MRKRTTKVTIDQHRKSGYLCSLDKSLGLLVHVFFGLFYVFKSGIFHRRIHQSSSFFLVMFPWFPSAARGCAAWPRPAAASFAVIRSSASRRPSVNQGRRAAEAPRTRSWSRQGGRGRSSRGDCGGTESWRGGPLDGRVPAPAPQPGGGRCLLYFCPMTWPSRPATTVWVWGPGLASGWRRKSPGALWGAGWWMSGCAPSGWEARLWGRSLRSP